MNEYTRQFMENMKDPEFRAKEAIKGEGADSAWLNYHRGVITPPDRPDDPEYMALFREGFDVMLGALTDANSGSRKNYVAPDWYGATPGR